MRVVNRGPARQAEWLHDGTPDLSERAAAALRAGQIVAIPTDTVYGYAAAIDQHGAIERLYDLKGRPQSKPIPLLLSDIDYLALVASNVNQLAQTLIAEFWPGPLTLVVPAVPHLYRRLVGEDLRGTRTVAVRIPDHALAREIIAFAGGAVAVTSANTSGERPAHAAHDVNDVGETAPDVIIAGGPATLKRPSTIILATAAEPIILREGSISLAELEARLSAARRHERSARSSFARGV